LNQYLPFREELHSDDIGTYVSYGIRVLDSQGNMIESISDVSVDKNFVTELCYLWTRYQLSPIHIQDILEDIF
jgi:hypothetical protein